MSDLSIDQTSAKTRDAQGLWRVIRGSILLLGGFLALLWIEEIVDQVFLGSALDRFGIVPRHLSGLEGILWAPLLHGGFAHLIANSSAILPFGVALLLRGRSDFVVATLIPWFLGGLGTWVIGASGVHIGASGVIFGWLGYLISRGFFDRTLGSILFSVLIGVAYGGAIYGVLPSQPGISWEGHLCGFLAGIVAAKWYSGVEKRAEAKREKKSPALLER